MESWCHFVEVSHLCCLHQKGVQQAKHIFTTINPSFEYVFLIGHLCLLLNRLLVHHPTVDTRRCLSRLPSCMRCHYELGIQKNIIGLYCIVFLYSILITAWSRSRPLNWGQGSCVCPAYIGSNEGTPHTTSVPPRQWGGTQSSTNTHSEHLQTIILWTLLPRPCGVKP